MRKTPIAATMPARIGDSRAGTMSLEMIPLTSMAPLPAATSVAPITDERVGGRRLEPEPPGPEVPADRTDQTAEDDGGRDVAGVHDAAGHGGRDLERDERADEVQDRGDPHGHAGREGARRDRRGHRVRGVVEALVKSNARATTPTRTTMMSPLTRRNVRPPRARRKTRLPHVHALM